MVLDTKAMLMDEALKLFSARGYDAVAVQEIVEAAGVTKPTLYHHFGSKRGMLDALLENRYRPLKEQLNVASRYEHDLTGSLRSVVTTYMAFAREHPSFFRLMRSMSIAPPESEAYQAISSYLRWELDTLEQLFIDAVPEHGNLQGHHQLYAITLQGIVLKTIDHCRQEKVRMNEDLVHNTVKLFMHGIYAL